MSTVDPPALWSSGPWAESYEFIRKLGDGGQGYTFHARRNSDQMEVAVKVLRPDRSTPKARRRMFREVNALRSLSKTEAFVPIFIESNIDSAIDDPEIRPYVVMEFIDGPTLLKSQQERGALPLPEAIRFSNILLDTVEIAHSEDTTHRDIKPQNIVLKNNDSATPYLIDFGLSFNHIVDHEDGLTSIRESIGNRFLTLPESESTGSELKHETASDLTLISGILFFLLTDKFPEYLSRDTANSPHRRNYEIFEARQAENLPYLMQFFDRAFQYDVTRRFQTAEELRNRINRIKDQSEGKLADIDPITVAQEIRDHVAAASRDYQLDSIEKKHEKCLDDFLNHVTQLSKNKALPPIQLQLTRQNFGNRSFNGVEVIRNPLLQIQATIPAYYQKIQMCRYFMTVDGDEISIAFQQIHSENNKDARQLPKQFNSTPIETLFSFFEWSGENTQFLKKHFANWFDTATRALTQ